MHIKVVPSQGKSRADSVIPAVQSCEVGPGWNSLKLGGVYLAGLVEDYCASPLGLLL